MGHESLPQVDRPDSVNDTQVRWARVNAEPFEYAIQQGPFGDDFVKLINGSCLRRSLTESGGKEQTNSRDPNG